MSATSQSEAGRHSERMARGELDFSLNFAAPLVLSIDAGDPVTVAGRCALRLLRAVRERARSAASCDLKGKSVGVQGLGLDPAHLPGGHGDLCRARSRQRHRLGDEPVGQADGAVRRRQDRRFPGLSARAAGAARPQDRPRDPQQRGRPAVVAVLLLPAVGQHGLRPRASDRDQARHCAPSSRPPTSASPSPSASRSSWSMAGSRRATTTRSRR